MDTSKKLYIRIERKINTAKWMIFTRWFYPIGILLIGFLTKNISHSNVSFSYTAMVSLFCSYFILNFIFWLAIKKTIKQFSSFLLNFACYGLIIAELVFFTIIMHLAGGVESVSNVFFFLPIVSASLIFSTKGSIATALTSGLIINSLILAEYYNFIPHVPRYSALTIEFTDLSIGLTKTLTNAIFFLIVGSFAGYGAKMLWRREVSFEEKTYELQTSVKELEKSQKALSSTLDDVKETRQKIEEEKNKTLAIIDNFADGLLVFDNKNFLILANPQAIAFFEMSAEKIIGQSMAQLNDRPVFKPLLELLKNPTKPVLRKEMVLHDLTLEISAIPMKSPKEKIGDLIIMHNVTREKGIERMKTEFVSIAAHQLRTPLSAVKWALSLLLDGDAGELNAEQKSFIDKSYESNERMIVLINDLLDVARIEEGRYLYKLVSAKLENLTQAALSACKEIATKRNIKLEYLKPAEALPEMMIDAEKIAITIQNLIENAIKYTPPGGQVTVSLRYDTNKAEVSVRDNGVGVNQEQQNRLFTKFFRASNVMRMETDGTGLGLFIAKNIIEAHGGKIWCESKENEGSVFSFSLPINH